MHHVVSETFFFFQLSFLFKCVLWFFFSLAFFLSFLYSLDTSFIDSSIVYASRVFNRTM